MAKLASPSFCARGPILCLFASMVTLQSSSIVLHTVRTVPDVQYC